jgi:hypothetical protein
MIEGAAGIEDSAIGFQKATISPRWPADPIHDIRDVYAVARYAASDAYTAYRWHMTPPTANRPGQLVLTATGSGEMFRLRLLLPPGTTPQTVPLQIEQIGFSRYLTLDVSGPIITVNVTLTL